MVEHHVYELVQGATVVYVGRSVNPRVRLCVFRKNHPELEVTQRVVFSGTLVACQDEERGRIAALRPALNKYVAASACRVGKKWSQAHKDNMSILMSGRTVPAEVRAKLWATRDKEPLRQRNRDKAWTADDRQRHAELTRMQFEDSEKRARHRDACIAAIARMRREGIRIGRKPRAQEA